MTLLALGLNHKTAPVDIRERVAFTPEKLPVALRELRANNSVTEVAILSTCNRTELYCGLEGKTPVQCANGSAVSMSSTRKRSSHFSMFTPIAWRCAYPAVASGLDSLVWGSHRSSGR